MRVLMIGWELPPYNSGGLGEACFSLAQSLSASGASVTFVLPRKVPVSYSFMKILFANVRDTYAQLADSYASASLRHRLTGIDELEIPSDFVQASFAYASQINKVVKEEKIDVIHAHDWLCVPAAIAVKKETGKPMVLHVHATEVDRAGGNFHNSYVYEIEKLGMQEADKIIAVSAFTKNIITTQYGINPSKVYVVHNGVDDTEKPELEPVLTDLKAMGYKIVLSLGRITLQKGPEYFVRAAKKVLDYEKKAFFVVAGSGDMMEKMIDEVYHLGLTDSFIFTGFVRGEDRDRLFQTADVFVMPSVSEPFGLTSLEAVSHRTPVITSKQSGVSEVLNHALKVDFWDIDEIANKIIAVIGHEALGEDLVKESLREIPSLSWNVSADKCIDVYKSIVT